MKIFILLFLFCHSTYAATKLTAAENFTAFVAHRLGKAKKYNELPQILNLPTNDRQLFGEDLHRQKKWDANFKFAVKGTTIILTSEKPEEFDFKNIAQKNILINGRSFKLQKGKGSYRENTLRLSQPKTASLMSWILTAHADEENYTGDEPLAPGVTPEIAALLESAQLDEEELAGAYGDGDNPLGLLQARYKTDQATAIYDAAAKSKASSSDKVALVMDSFTCEGTQLRSLQTRGYKYGSSTSYPAGPEISKKDGRYTMNLVPIAEPERSDLDDSVKLAEACCAHAGCPAAAKTARDEIVAKISLRSQLEPKDVGQ